MVELRHNLTADEYGIWRTARSYCLSYPEHGNDACFQLEDASFWFRHRNECILAAVRRYPPSANGPIVDVKQARGFGTSKWTLAKKLKLFIDSMVSFSYVPIRLMSVLGSLMAASGFGYAFAVVVGRLTGWVSAGTGFAALMTALLIGQGSILLMLGILGEYLWRTFDEARGRPRYIIEEYITSKDQQSSSHTKDNLP